MHRAVLILAALLAAGCPKSGSTAGPATNPLWGTDTVLSQQEMAKRFAAEPTVYRGCVAMSEDELVEGSHAYTVAVSEQAVEVTWDDGTTTTLTPDPRNNVFLLAPDDPDPDKTAVVLIDDLIYLLRDYSDFGFDVRAICDRNGSEAIIRGITGGAHAQRVRDYHLRRGHLAVAAEEASQNVITPEDEERLALARTAVALTLSAYANGPESEVAWNVTAELSDGTTLFFRGDDKLFDLLFDTSFMPGEVGVYAQVWLKDDQSIRDDQEVFYARDGSREFECHGQPGAVGSDVNYYAGGGMYYEGQRGEDGPDVTVEITTTGRSNDRGEQILRYRLRCGEQVEQFDASASSEVFVGTYGGKGGYGIPKNQGAGSDGGWGGDGGDIVVIVDPSVEGYAVIPVSRGGDGGGASDPDQTNDSEEGTPGKAGEHGTISKRRETVVIPDEPEYD